MPNGEQQASEVTRKRVEELKDSILEEFKALVEKLPWWKQALLALGVVTSLIAAVLGCAAISTATGPAAVVAWIACILGAIGALVTLGFWIADLLGERSEAAEIEKKKIRLEEAKTILEKQQAGGH
ncbi:MAG: hypothetical protein WHX53_10575 [Anaerolineae bacterium]|jgi:uncharacterized protein YacL